jgi:DNA repair exonuclease SbcCD ATPase subunit
MSGKAWDEIQALRKKIASDRAERSMYQESLRRNIFNKRKYEKALDGIERLNAILQQVAQQTQLNFEQHISTLVTTSLAAVFEDPYNFKVAFEMKRDKTECQLLFERDGEAFKPMDSSGGGPIDISSIALRLSAWSIKKTRPVILLDEPCKFVSRDRLPYVLDMIRLLNEKLGIQIVMVTHIPEFKEVAEQILTVKDGNIEQDVLVEE